MICILACVLIIINIVPSADLAPCSCGQCGVLDNVTGTVGDGVKCDAGEDSDPTGLRRPDGKTELRRPDGKVVVVCCVVSYYT